MKRFIWLILAVVVAIGLVLLLSKNQPDQEDVADQETESEQNSALLVGDNAIFVEDQRPGQAVIVRVAVLEAPGFVVIHESENNQPATVVGSSRLLPEGSSEDVTVTLIRAAEEGQEFYAMLHIDNGDSAYSTEDDQPATSPDGSPILMKFMIDSEADTSVDISL